MVTPLLKGRKGDTPPYPTPTHRQKTLPSPYHWPIHPINQTSPTTNPHDRFFNKRNPPPPCLGSQQRLCRLSELFTPAFRTLHAAFPRGSRLHSEGITTAFHGALSYTGLLFRGDHDGIPRGSRLHSEGITTAFHGALSYTGLLFRGDHDGIPRESRRHQE